MRPALIVAAFIAIAAPAVAQVTSRAPEWARALLVSDEDAILVRQSALAAPEGGIAARLSIAPAEGGVARLVRFEASPAGAKLTVRRFTGHNRSGWVLWGAEQAVPAPLAAPQRATLERLARAALSATLIGGESGTAADSCTSGDFVWLEMSEPGRTAVVERRCDPSGAAGAFVRALSDAAGSRDEEELYQAGVAEILATDRAFAQAAQASGMAAAMSEYAGQRAQVVPGAGPAVQGHDAIGAFYAGAEPFTWEPGGAEVSARGDMGWSWGHWTRGETQGDYVSVWRRDGDGAWRYAARSAP